MGFISRALDSGLGRYKHVLPEPQGMLVKADVIRLAIGIFMTPYISRLQQRFAARDNSREQLL